MKPTKSQPKLFYKIEEVSRLTGLDAATIESWEKEFSFLQPGLTGAGKKIFRPKDVDMIRRIKTLLANNSVTLAGAKRIIEEEFELRPPPAVHPDRLIKSLRSVRDELHDIARRLDKPAKKR